MEMDDFQVVYPPNRPMERRYNIPKVPEKPSQAFFIDCNENGQLILGSSDFISSWWNGALFVYESFDDAKHSIVSKRYLDETTISDGKYIDNEHIILGSDLGRMSVLNVSEQPGDGILSSKDAFRCTTRIIQVDLWKTTKNVVACSEDTITIWNTTGSLAPTKTFRNYHTDLISSVSCLAENDMFVTGSWDKRVCLWDVRSDTPATVINNTILGAVTAVSACVKESQYILMGTVGGLVCSIDTRKPKEFVDKFKSFDLKIHKLCCNPNNMYVAACSDTNTVKIIDCDKGELKVVYESSTHPAMVRGFTWNKDDLLACGLDGQIYKHICV